MPKRPRKPKREDFNEAAFRVVREATEEHTPPSRPETPSEEKAEPGQSDGDPDLLARVRMPL